jgi:hypothetical protein
MLTKQQIERAVYGMAERVVGEFERCEITMEQVMTRFDQIDKWEQERLQCVEEDGDNERLISDQPNRHGRGGREGSTPAEASLSGAGPIRPPKPRQGES